MTNAEIAILSLIAEQPRHGYEIETVIEARGMRAWTEIGFSSIYYLLKKLEQGGLVTKEVHEAKQGPNRKVYQVTPTGIQALKGATYEALSTLHRCHTPFLLGLANLPWLADDEIAAALESYRDQLVEQRDHIAAALSHQRPVPDFVEAMFDYSITLTTAELQWIDQFILERGRPMTTKLDLKKTEKHLYSPSKKQFSIVEVPPMQFLMIDGTGNPNTSQAFKEAVEALFAVSYTTKFMSKQELGTDYVVMPLEGLWWAEDMDTFDLWDKDNWLWTVMIRQPDHITAAMIEDAIERTRAKKDPTALPLLRFETYAEGLSAQILYIGPFSDEAPTIAAMHEHFHELGYVENGKHHEIYLSDFNRTAPEKLKTVIRQPIRQDN